MISLICTQQIFRSYSGREWPKKMPDLAQILDSALPGSDMGKLYAIRIVLPLQKK
jgi:hypothetical protein